MDEKTKVLNISMNLNQTFFDFCRELGERKHLLTEDNIRYYWFAQMLKQDQVLDHYCLEDKYSGLSQISGKSELDLHYKNGTDDLRFEMKMHLDASHSIPMTQNAGEVFNDLQRLQSISSGRKFFLYVTGETMEKYYRGDSGDNKSSKEYAKVLKEVFTLPAGIIYSAWLKSGDVPKTFKESANKTVNTEGHPIQFDMKVLFSAQFCCPATMEDDSTPFANGTLHVRLFEVIK